MSSSIQELKLNVEKDYSREGLFVPEWLKFRPFTSDDPGILITFSEISSIKYFSEITKDKINDFTSQTNYEIGYKLLKLLGLYGVEFFSRAAIHSKTLYKYPVLLKIDYFENQKVTFIKFNEGSDGSIQRNSIKRLINFLLKNELDFSYYLNGIRLDTLSLVTEINIDLLKVILSIPCFKIIDNIDEVTNFYKIYPIKECVLTGLDNVLEEVGIQENLIIGMNEESQDNYDYIDKLNLSVRARNVLKRYKINQINKLIELTDDEIINFENCGTKTLEEIKAVIKDIKLVNTDNIKIFEPVASDDYIDTLNISVRAKNILKVNKINTIKKLIELTDEQIIASKNCGTKTFEEIKEVRERAKSDYFLDIQYFTIELDDKLSYIINKQFRLSEVTIKILDILKIEKIWQLLQIFPDFIVAKPIIEVTDEELLEFENCSIRILEDMKDEISSITDLSSHLYVVVDKNLNVAKNKERILEFFKFRKGYKSSKKFYDGSMIKFDYLPLVYKELLDLVNQLGYNYPVRFTPEQLLELNKPTISEILRIEIFKKILLFPKYLDNIVQDEFAPRCQSIYRERIKPPPSKQSTLDEIGISFNVTRERIRQIEKKLLKNLTTVFYDYFNEKEINKNLSYLFGEYGSVLHFNLFPEVNCVDTLTEADKHIISSFLRENGHTSDSFNIDWELKILWKNNIGDIRSNIRCLAEEIKKLPDFNPYSINEEQTSNEVIKVFSSIINKDNIDQEINFDNVINELSCYIIEQNSELSDGYAYAAYKFGELFPEGAYIYRDKNKIFDELCKHVPSLREKTIKAVIARITDKKYNLLLWREGFYIHKSKIYPDWSLLDLAIEEAIKLFEQGIFEFKIHKIFNEHEEIFKQRGIPTTQALYSLLRLKGDKRVIVEDYPRLWDGKVGEDIRSYPEIINDYFKDRKCLVKLDELRRYFCSERGWKEYELYLVLDKIKEIIATGEGYIHIDFVSYDQRNLGRIVAIIEEELQLFEGVIHLRKIRGKHPVSWFDVFKGDIRPELMGAILEKYENKKFHMEKRVYAISKNVENKQDINSVTILSKMLLDKKNILHFSEIQNYFEQKGFTVSNLRDVIRRANILRVDNDCFIHPDVIGYRDEMLEVIEEILEEGALKEKEINNPYISFEYIINYFYEKLPSLDNEYDWYPQLLAGISEKIDSVMVFYGVYVLRRNEFNIEDFDDLIAFIIARNYENGICKVVEIEKELQKLEIIPVGGKLSTYKSDLFFDGSSVELVDDNNRIRLSTVGIKRYLKYE